jgi:hypothetical protein
MNTAAPIPTDKNMDTELHDIDSATRLNIFRNKLTEGE